LTGRLSLLTFSVTEMNFILCQFGIFVFNPFFSHEYVPVLTALKIQHESKENGTITE
jgi:hypothetical protein